ncbi:MAG: nucleoside 2-deoxyribosyltransferase, partial [Myxococcales bacterium]|nr:nucleoside 2-deoxyribosyltransferase [Myxococcales bacterium]
RTRAFDELCRAFREKSYPHRAVLEGSCLSDMAQLWLEPPRARKGSVRAKERPTVYVAGPHKNVAANNSVRDVLVDAGFDVKVPFAEVRKQKSAIGSGRPERIRAICMKAIDQSDFIAVDLDAYGLDTAWEIGYAEGIGKRVVGYNRDVFLISEQRLINRRLYNENFMHGWSTQTVFNDLEKLAEACTGRSVYIGGSFSNPSLESILSQNLLARAKHVVFPRDQVDERNLLPRDYPLAERGETNSLLEDSEVLVVALPRYGMDCSWQIGLASALGKNVIGILLDDDGVEGVRQSFWDHWMHGWRTKIRVTGEHELAAVLSGLTSYIDAKTS